MSTIVSDIRSAIQTRITAVLPAAWNELRYTINVEQNDSRNLNEAYGLRYLSGPFADTVTKSYAIDQGFELILSRTNGRRSSDDDSFDAQADLYDKADDIMNDLILTKAGAANVLKIDQPNFNEPEFLLDSEYVVLRVQFIVKYRRILT